MTWAMEVTSEATSMTGPRLRRRAGLVDHVDDVAHDAREVEVFGRVDAGDAGAEEAAFVLERDDAADDDGDMAGALLAQATQHLLRQHDVRAGKDGEADDMGTVPDR